MLRELFGLSNNPKGVAIGVQLAFAALLSLGPATEPGIAFCSFCFPAARRAAANTAKQCGRIDFDLAFTIRTCDLHVRNLAKRLGIFKRFFKVAHYQEHSHGH